MLGGRKGKYMMKGHIPSEEAAMTRKPTRATPDKRHASERDRMGPTGLQQLVGNRAVQRLFARRGAEQARGNPADIQRHVPEETTEDLRWSMGMIDEGLDALAQAPQGTEDAQQSIAMGRFGVEFALDSIEGMPATEETGEAAAGAVPSASEMPLRPMPPELGEGGPASGAVPSAGEMPLRPMPSELEESGTPSMAVPSASEMPLKPLPSELSEGAAPGGAGGAVPSAGEMPLRPMPSELSEGGTPSTAVPSASEMPLKPMPSELAEGAVPTATEMPLRPMPPEWEER
jgi:hypothetical protein